MSLSSSSLVRRRSLFLAGVLGACLVLARASHAQDQTVNGALGIMGEADVHGDALRLGSWSDNANTYGLIWAYAENAQHVPTIALTATRPDSTWLWQKHAPTGNTGNQMQMSLNGENALTLYDEHLPDARPAIALHPLGTSTFRKSVLIYGTDNQMPNQLVTGNASVLTVGLGDGRYLTRSSGDQLTFGNGASAAGQSAIALGYQANASGDNSLVLGNNATASSTDATALGKSASATGAYTTALGWGANANGAEATALGVASIASGVASTALGTHAEASQYETTALGERAVASGVYATAVGTYAAATGDHSTAVGENTGATSTYTTAIGMFVHANGYLSSAFGAGSLANGYEASALGFQSGASGIAATSLGMNSAAMGDYSVTLGSFSSAIGSYSTALTSSSAAVGDYSVAAGRTQATSAYQFVTGAYAVPGGNAHNWVPTDDLFTVGNGQTASTPSNAFSVKKNGDTTVSGKLMVTAAIIVQPQGDLQMGEFIAQPSPSPTP